MGRGHGHRNNADSNSTASTLQDPIASERFALPPLLKIDSVLLVQQANVLQIQLDNGEQLQVRLDWQTRQSLNGDAMVHARFDANDLHITIHYADGTELEQDWARSSDGHHLTIIGWCKLPTLQRPIRFRRSYLAVG